MLTDLKYALRQIAKFPGYSAVVVLTLAFGIAVNTQIFSIVSAFFLRPMPVRDAGRLVTLIERSDVMSLPLPISFIDFQDFRAEAKTLKDHVAYFSMAAHVSVPGKSPERIWIEAITPDAFSKLGVTVALGRPLQLEDGLVPPGVPVTVLTYKYWQTQLGADPNIVGRTLMINAKQFTVVGVAKPGFESLSWASSVGMFVPSGTFPMLRTDGEVFFKYRSASAWRVLAYLAPGATLADANAELGVFAKRFAQEDAESHRDVRFQAFLEQHARPDPVVADRLPVFIALFCGLVVLVLFIACANVANLMSVRALAREKEYVVRSALGASRWRLIRQLLVESLLLAAIAGVVGRMLAEYGSALFTRFAPAGDLPVRTQFEVGWEVGGFTAAISLIAGLAAGLFPAIRSSRVDLNQGLKQGGRQTADGRHRIRNLLVVGQVATSCVVLIAAALFLRGLHAARDLDFGFKADRLLMLSFDLGLQGYDEPRGVRFERNLLDRVRELPGVVAASTAQHVPFSNNIVIRDTWPDNPSGNVPDGHVTVALSAVDPSYLKTLGITLLRGRDLFPSDNEQSAQVAVINEAMAKAFWPGRDALGQHFRMWRDGPPIEVVGIVPTGKYVMLTEEPKPYFYRPIAQAYGMPATLIVRTAAINPVGLAKTLRDTVHALDPDLPIYSLITFDEHMATSIFGLMPLRFGATLAGVQGAIGLLLAIMGLYSVVSYDVTRRTREIGVRMALGATDAQVLRLVSRDGLRLTLIGLAMGIAVALVLSMGLSRVLFGIHPGDPLPFLITTGLIYGTAALACWLPARRATQVNPIEALRAE